MNKSLRESNRRQQMSSSSFLAAYRSGQRAFHYIDISGANLSNKDIPAASFYGADLRGTNFSGSRDVRSAKGRRSKRCQVRPRLA